jgi:RND superfamily putative drug exporter
MFSALGRFTTRKPWIVIGIWVIAAVVIISLAPKLTSTSNEADFLPKHYESIKALDLQQEEFAEATQPGAILVFDRADSKPLTAEDSADVEKIVAELNKDLPKAFSGGAAQPPSENKLVQIAVIGLSDETTGFDSLSMDGAKELREQAKPLLKGTDLRLGMTGAAPQGLDSQESTETTMQIVGLATIVLIIVLLALIFRSVIICLMPILVVTLVSMVATGLIGTANKVFDLKADSSIQVILIVVLYGIGTDYILFFLFRYRERLRQGDEAKGAVAHALERAGEAIASAGGAVIVAFMALVLSSLSIFRSIGPALAIAVGVTLLAALTLVPAVVTLLGKYLFWPAKNWNREPESTRFAAMGEMVGRHPIRMALVSGGVMAVLAGFAFGFNPSFDFSSSLPKGVESTVALKRLEKGLPAGATDPTTVILHSTTDKALTPEELQAFAGALSKAEGVAMVAPGTPSQDGRTAMFSAILKEDPGSDLAMDEMRDSVRPAAHKAAPEGSTAYVGGTTAIFLDLQKAMQRDYSVVFPAAAIVIMLILALLLRSLVAPFYLMASVGLGFGATLGATVILFQHIRGESGLIFMLPMYIYLFVVALGTDYNILMIARLREEAREGKNPRDAAAAAVKHAGPTIAAAGLILAGTFAALLLGGNSLIVSMGFALSFGIGMAAFVMSMFFTPSLTALIGHAAWWPGHGDEPEISSDAPQAQ